MALTAVSKYYLCFDKELTALKGYTSPDGWRT